MDYNKHDYDDYFKGLDIDERDLHYCSEDGKDAVKVNFFINNPSEESPDQFGLMNFFVYKEDIKKYEPSINTSTKRIFEKQSLLVTPIDELEILVKEQQMIRASQMEQEAAQKEDEVYQIAKAESVRDRQLWVDKYMPKRFDELLSLDKTNRDVLCWLKAWDPIVFKKSLKWKKLAAPYNPNYGKNMFGQTFQANQSGNFNNNNNTGGGVKSSVYNNNYNKNQSGNHNNNNNNNNNNNQNNFQYAAQKPFYYDLSDEYSVNKMQNSVVLLAGPPGSGKTTLARTIAQHCGYKSIEINASEDRTAVKLIERIETMTRNEALQFKTGADSDQKDKPSLIIIDEVDGALESENHGAVNHLLDFIFKGQKNLSAKAGGGAGQVNAAGGKQTNNQGSKKKGDQNKKKKKNDEDDEDKEDGDDNEINDNMEEEKNKQSGNQNVHIRRPVIFICNDVYSKGLRELRKRALVFNFQKARSDKLVQRLKEICQKEKLYVDQYGLTKICDHNENDIRSTLMNLQMISKLQRTTSRSRISIDQILIEEKNNTKSLLELLECVMMVSNARNDPNIDIMRYTIHTLIKNTQPDLLLDTTLINYTKLKSSERHFEKIPQFLNDLAFAEILESNLLKHNYEMYKFISLPLINFGLCLKSNERTKLDYPKDNFFLKKRTKAAIDCVETLLENFPHQDAPYLNKKTFILEYLSNIYQIIQPNISSSMISDNEKRDLFQSLSIMIDFSLKMLDHPMKIDKNGVKFNIYFTPNIERMLMFGNDFPLQRLNEKSIHFILNNYEMIHHQKMLAKELADDDIQQKKIEQKLMNVKMLDNQYNNKHLKRKKRVEGENATFLYKFREGVSIPIKYDVKMKNFFD